MVILMEFEIVAMILTPILSLLIIYYKIHADRLIGKLKEIDCVIDAIIEHYEDDDSIDTDELKDILKKVHQLIQ